MENLISERVARAMEESEVIWKKSAAYKAHQAQKRYEKALQATKQRKERSERAVMRAALSLMKSRQKIRYIESQLAAIRNCIQTGQPYRKRYEKKAKPERAISFD